MLYVELGMVIWKFGGEYSYIKEVLGDILVFLFVWMLVIVVWIFLMGIICLMFGEYMVIFFFYCGLFIILIKFVVVFVIGMFYIDIILMCYWRWFDNFNIYNVGYIDSKGCYEFNRNDGWVVVREEGGYVFFKC